MNKQRLDQLLVEKGLLDSREKAKRYIMAGLVLVDGQLLDKPGMKVDSQLNIKIKQNSVSPYVSRGGMKLAKALPVFDINVVNKVALDVGASTGGFTDCLLQNGIKKVYAIDVGYGQLDWKLRNDKRVIVMERTNVRYLTPQDLPEFADLATIDVAFISLTKFFEGLLNLLTENGEVIALIKPQFEVGRKAVGKKGVVRDFSAHLDMIKSLVTKLQTYGVGLVGLDYSPIRGPKGNIEYLAHFRKEASFVQIDDLAEEVVNKAQTEFELSNRK